MPELVAEVPSSAEWTITFHQAHTADPPDRPMAIGWLEPQEIRMLYGGQGLLSSYDVLSIEVHVGPAATAP